MKLQENPILPQNPDTGYARLLNTQLAKLFLDISKKVNQISGGSVAGLDGGATAAPTTGTWAQGDYIVNSNPVEAGAATAKYVVRGFICTVGGTPGTWLQCRDLTGN